MPITEDCPSAHIPHTVATISADTWYISGSQVRKNNSLLKENYSVNLNRLSVGDRVGIRVTSDRILKLFINGESAGPAAFNLPKVGVPRQALRCITNYMYLIIGLYIFGIENVRGSGRSWKH